MKRFIRRGSVLTLFAMAVVFAMQTGATAPSLPNPTLTFLGAEPVEVSGKQLMRYYFAVDNRSVYSAEMFASAPDLPPCGANTKSSRTWVDIYTMAGKRLNGFCALGKPDDLNKLWFALDSEVVPPSWIYIELNDRKTGTKYKSNLADTTL